MNYFITGLDGFVGSHLAEYLLEKNESVWGLIKNDSISHNIESIETMLNIIEGDLLELEALKSIIKSVKPSVIIHLAGQNLYEIAKEKPHQTMQINILGTLNILEAIRLCSPKTKLVIGMSCDIHGKNFDQPICEGTPIAPNSPLAASQATSDMISRQYAESYGLDVVIARMLALIGPRQNKRYVVSEYARKICKAQLGMGQDKITVGKLTAERDFIDVRDAVRVIYSIASKDNKFAEYTICSGKKYRLRYILDTLMEIAEVDYPIEVSAKRIRNADIPIVIGDPSRIKDEFNFEPKISMEQSLIDIYRYWFNRLERNEF